MTARSYLFVPANRPELLVKAMSSQADAVVIDLEDAVPADEKEAARRYADALIRGLGDPERARVWVRINAVGTPQCEDDVAMLTGTGVGVRVPKVDSTVDLDWVANRTNEMPMIATIESASGLCAAPAIARHAGVVRLAVGGLDLIHDLRCGEDRLALLFARSSMVVASRAAGLPGPINSVYSRLDDVEGFRRHVRHAANLGCGAQSVLSPRQLGVVHEIYSADAAELAWARSVLHAFKEAGGQATRSASGEFVDLPVARRAAEIVGESGSV